MSVQSLRDLDVVLGAESSRSAELSKTRRAPEEGEALNLTSRLTRINTLRAIDGIFQRKQ